MIKEVDRKQFKLQKEATAWAKSEKKRAGKTANLRWETNRTNNPTMPWEAILYRKV